MTSYNQKGNCNTATWPTGDDLSSRGDGDWRRPKLIGKAAWGDETTQHRGEHSCLSFSRTYAVLWLLVRSPWFRVSQRGDLTHDTTCQIQKESTNPWKSFGLSSNFTKGLGRVGQRPSPSQQTSPQGLCNGRYPQSTRHLSESVCRVRENSP